MDQLRYVFRPIVHSRIQYKHFCVLSHLSLLYIDFDSIPLSLSLSLHLSAIYNSRKFPDQHRVHAIYEKLSRLYSRIIKSHENIDNVLESIRIWGHVPLYQRRESNATSLLDIDDRSIKFKSRCIEVNNSKKLIEYTMEENYRLLFDLPLLERKKEFGKDRLRNTIMRKFGRPQAKDKIERSPSVVSFHHHFRTKGRRRIFVFYSNFQIELYGADAIADNALCTERIEKTPANLALFRSYEEYVDKLISQALLNGIEAR